MSYIRAQRNYMAALTIAHGGGQATIHITRRRVQAMDGCELLTCRLENLAPLVI